MKMTRLTLIVEAPTDHPNLAAAIFEATADTVKSKGFPPDAVTDLWGVQSVAKDPMALDIIQKFSVQAVIKRRITNGQRL